MFKCWLYKLAQHLVNHLSIEQSYIFAVWLADLHRSYSHRDRQAVYNNLTAILPSDQNVSVAVKEVFRNFGRYLSEFLRMEKHLTEEYIASNCTVEGLHHFDEVLARGRGGILLSAHLGNWELGSALISRKGYPITVVALPHKDRGVNAFFNHQRSVQGITVVPTNIGVRKCIDALNNNEFIAIAADRDFNMSGEAIEFFGRKSLMPKGAASFSLKTGAAIIPTFLLRESPNRFKLRVRTPISPAADTSRQNRHDGVIALMQQCAAVLEEEIKKNPAQWTIFRRFWI